MPTHLAHRPPAATLPPVPDGFVEPNPWDFQGYRPLASHIAALPDALTELQSFADYADVFGITAPDRAQLLQRVAAAAEWTAVLAQAAAWRAYVTSQEAVAWKDALLLVQALKAPFELASRASPALRSRCPALARLLGARKAVARRAAATRALRRGALARDEDAIHGSARAMAWSASTSHKTPRAAPDSLTSASDRAPARAIMRSAKPTGAVSTSLRNPPFATSRAVGGDASLRASGHPTAASEANPTKASCWSTTGSGRRASRSTSSRSGPVTSWRRNVAAGTAADPAGVSRPPRQRTGGTHTTARHVTWCARAHVLHSRTSTEPRSALQKTVCCTAKPVFSRVRWRRTGRGSGLMLLGHRKLRAASLARRPRHRGRASPPARRVQQSLTRTLRAGACLASSHGRRPRASEHFRSARRMRGRVSGGPS